MQDHHLWLGGGNLAGYFFYNNDFFLRAPRFLLNYTKILKIVVALITVPTHDEYFKALEIIRTDLMLHDLSARVIPHDLACQPTKFDSAQAVFVRFTQQSPEQVVLRLAQCGPVIAHVPTSPNSSIIVYAAVEAALKAKQHLFCILR